MTLFWLVRDAQGSGFQMRSVHRQFKPRKASLVQGSVAAVRHERSCCKAGCLAVRQPSEKDDNTAAAGPDDEKVTIDARSDGNETGFVADGRSGGEWLYVDP
ncbi:hypothetical protein [Alteripontixanthobacter muriae]|uniref:hypothetical protein n=1 Tax=Alteripontixanthobacter muriae TaxID=2705546 RepID=UPI0019D532FA|nr:hypothetical protein [Alteripontixanthobacter muriae]